MGTRHEPERRPLPARLAAALLAGAAVGGVLFRRTPAPLAAPVRADQEDGPVAVVGPPPVPAAPPERPAAGGPAADRSPLPSVILAVAAVVVTALQIDASATENRYLAEAAQGADRVGTVGVGSGPREAFASNGQQLVVLMQQRADAVADAGRSATAADRGAALVTHGLPQLSTQPLPSTRAPRQRRTSGHASSTSSSGVGPGRVPRPSSRA